MCGIAGFWALGSTAPPEERAAQGLTMAATLRNRGPDDEGSWQDAVAGVVLVHRRLSILDLSPAGHQPMSSACGRYQMVFNGEVYNHRMLRAELTAAGAAPLWRGHSDTETLLAAFRFWGIESSLRRFNGMFALALWDRQARQLTFARDRFGEKPLYFGLQSGTLLFGSELKALRAHPAFAAPVDRDALALFLQHSFVPAPHSIYQGIAKLEQGAWLTVGEADLHRRSLPSPKRYWDALAVAESAALRPATASVEALIDELDTTLATAVGLRLESDVPLGAFLSGGVDSSLVVALMQRHATRRVQTFSIGFGEAEYNEAEHARAVAAHLGTAHVDVYVSPQDALDVVPKLPALYDEPFADASQIPTYLVSALARQHVTVALSGDGGDELFNGYDRYPLVATAWARLRRLPLPVRRLGVSVLSALSPAQWSRLKPLLIKIMPARMRHQSLGDKVYKLIEILDAEDRADCHLRHISHWGARAVPGARPGLTAYSHRDVHPKIDDFESFMMALETAVYLPDNVLTKTDRATMAVSLEGRAPLLDPNVYQLAWQIPAALKRRDGRNKWILREVLDRYVPRALVDRPKMGFAVPIDHWLRGPLRDWAEDLLDPLRMRDDGLLDVDFVRNGWQSYLRGDRASHNAVWDVLMWQAWQREAA